MSEQGFVVRFNGKLAIIEDAAQVRCTIARSLLPEQTNLGDFVIREDGQARFRIDYKITEERLRELRRLSDNQFD
ncbi:MAG: DUF3006 family protein [Oscillospiraceae bacterium]|nr:DUF3006 family protein [Oscillospiraceae bacterium]MDD4367922.1 DUF3006 family protein [Oscillospiraceae bacterium]